MFSVGIHDGPRHSRSLTIWRLAMDAVDAEVVEHLLIRRHAHRDALAVVALDDGDAREGRPLVHVGVVLDHDCVSQRRQL